MGYKRRGRNLGGEALAPHFHFERGADGGVEGLAVDRREPVAPALGGGAPLGFAELVLQGRSQPGVAVTDDEVRTAQRFAFTNLRLVVEPGGAAALAAALAGKVPVDADTFAARLPAGTSVIFSGLRCV